MAWEEVISSGGPTSGRLWVANYNGTTYAGTRATGTPSNNRWLYATGDTTATTASSRNFSGTGGSDNHMVLGSMVQSDDKEWLLFMGGEQDNSITDRPAMGIAANPSETLPSGGVFVSNQGNGAIYGLSFGVVTSSSINRWIYYSDDLGASTTFRWGGGNSMPTGFATSFTATQFSQIGTEGYVSTEETTPAAYGYSLYADNRRPAISILTSSGPTAYASTAVSGWTGTDTVELGQCFSLPGYGVAVAYNSTRDETRVVVISGAGTFTVQQTISGKVLGGAALGSTGYIIKDNGDLLSSSGTSDFTSVSDAYGGGTPLALGLNPAKDGIIVWDDDGAVAQWSEDPASTGSTAWGGAWNDVWGTPWGV